MSRIQCKKSTEVGQLFSLETASNIQKKTIPKSTSDQIVKSENHKTF